MKLIQIGSDRNVFEKNSLVAKRLSDYAERTEELHLIVFSLKKHKLKKTKRGNLHLYPTNTFTRLGSLFKAKKIGQKIIGGQKDFIISTQDPFEAGWVGLKLKEKMTVKLQVQIHTDFLSKFFKDRILNRIRLKIAKKVLPEADGIRVVSERIKKSLTNSDFDLKVEPQILPIMNFHRYQTDKELSNQIHSISGLKITILARLEKEKNLELALRVFANIWKEGVNINLLIAGSGSLINSLQILARKLRIHKRVYFLGNVSDTVSLLKNSDIYLQTSNFEGFGLALYEARKIGLPIITTDVGLVGSIIKNGEGALVCEPQNEECLTNVLKSVVFDENLRNNMANFEFKNNNFPADKEKFIDQYFNLLSNI